MIAEIFSAVPDKYHSVLKVEQCRCNLLTFDNLEDAMNALRRHRAGRQCLTK
jgi:hypothetical protein